MAGPGAAWVVPKGAGIIACLFLYAKIKDTNFGPSARLYAALVASTWSSFTWATTISSASPKAHRKVQIYKCAIISFNVDLYHPKNDTFPTQNQPLVSSLDMGNEG